MSRPRSLRSRLWPFGSSDSDSDCEGSVWDLIPSWQYGGLHTESGGIARDEQERALDELRDRAAAEEEVDRSR